jgi:hypothetical protein
MSSTGPLVTGRLPGSVLVDVLDPEQRTYKVDGNGAVGLVVPAQKAMVLVPQDQVVGL